MYLSQLVIPVMKTHGGGNIVNVASISGITADSNGTLYGASKAGVINLTKYIATQTGKKNIRCNAVAPGLVLTPTALNNLNEDVRNIFPQPMCNSLFRRTAGHRCNHCLSCFR